MMFFSGVFFSIYNVFVNTLIQQATPENLLGRVFGLLGTLSAGLMPIGMGLSGWLADLLDQNVPLMFSGSGIILFTVSVLMILKPSYRAYLGQELKT